MKTPLEFEERVALFIRGNSLFAPDDRIVLAVSGGADSTAMLYALAAAEKQNIKASGFVCAHINHQLRGSDSDEDERFVCEQGQRCGLPVVTRRVDVSGFARKYKLSIETAARKLRIEELSDIAKQNGCTIIATAHQADDNAETILHRLLRGCGFRGIAGIQPRKLINNVWFVRPLLGFWRADIIEYLNRREIFWRTDATNFECRYKRNFIRHRLLPYLQGQSSQSVVEQLSALSRATLEFYNSVNNQADELWPQLAHIDEGGVKLDLKVFLQQQPEVKVELVRKSLIAIHCPEGNLTQRHFEKIMSLAGQNVSNKKIILPDGFAATRQYDSLIFERQGKTSRKEESHFVDIELQIPGRTSFEKIVAESAVYDDVGKSLEDIKAHKKRFVEQFDFERIVLPVRIRRPVAGDRFWPLGLGAEKKVARFLIDEKVPQNNRQKSLVIADKEKIIWLWPFRMCEQAKVTEKTKRILQMKIEGDI